MEIYDLTEEQNPVCLSDFNHVRSCDPVVVQGDIAYVTLRSGSFCGGNPDTTPQTLKSLDDTSSHLHQKAPFGIGGRSLRP